MSHTHGDSCLCVLGKVWACVCVCVCPLLHQEGFAAMRTRMFYLCRQHVHCACYLIILVIFLCMFCLCVGMCMAKVESLDAA